VLFQLEHCFLFIREKAEKGDRIFPDVGVDDEGDGVADLGKAVERCQGDKHVIADAVDIDDDRLYRFPGEHAAEARDHLNLVLSHGMGVAYGHGKGVGGVGRWRLGKVEQHRHHPLYLVLLGPSVTDDGLLDFQG